MVKMFYFFKRRPEMSVAEFHRYWREQHGPLFCNSELARRYVLRYEQNHAAPENSEIGGNDFDGVSIAWFRSVADVHAMRAHPDFRDVVVADGEKFIDPTATKMLMTLAEEPFTIVVDKP
jgi:uncharacterized protein (TIGR02118 family)